MFTGIIEEVGLIKSFKKQNNGAFITVSCNKITEDMKIGDSISINGVCQTVVEMSENSFQADVSDETLSVTNFSDIKQGDKVNLERALSLNSRIGGHIVSGHVESTVKFLNSEKQSEFYNMYFEIDENFSKYVIKKGSITLNGVSLTVADMTENVIMTAVIPHTYENTNLSELKSGDRVNLETDIFAKYIEKFLLNKTVQSVITEDFLKENGFI